MKYLLLLFIPIALFSACSPVNGDGEYRLGYLTDTWVNLDNDEIKVVFKRDETGTFIQNSVDFTYTFDGKGGTITDVNSFDYDYNLMESDGDHILTITTFGQFKKEE